METFISKTGRNEHEDEGIINVEENGWEAWEWIEYNDLTGEYDGPKAWRNSEFWHFHYSY